MGAEDAIEILIDTTGGETRAVLRRAGVVRRLVIDRGGIAVGDVFRARVSARRPEQDSSVVTLARGVDGFLPDAACPDGVPAEGQAVLVQVTRTAQGGKGPKLTARPSLEGRWVVYTPYLGEIRIGKKLLDSKGRARLRGLFRQKLDEGDGGARDGVTLRTAGAEAQPEQPAGELDRLKRLWGAIGTRVPQTLPVCVHHAPRPVDRMVFDVPGGRLSRLVVDGPAGEITRRWRLLCPERATLLTVWRGPEGLFEREGVEEEIETALSTEVALPGGGRLIIEPAAALVAIDVDGGGAGFGGQAGQRRRKVNRAAALEASRQIKLRNLSGLIAVDVLKPGSGAEKDELLRLWQEAFADEVTRQTRILGLTKGGVLEIVRVRRDAPLHEFYQKPGTVKCFTPTTSAFAAARALLRQHRRDPAGGYALAVSPAVAAAFEAAARPAWQAMAAGLGCLPHLVEIPRAAEDDFELRPLPRG